MSEPSTDRLPASVVLTGFMGTGKTTVGRLLAAATGRRFVDTDDLIIERHGPIAAIFADHGEERFRSIEREVAAELAGERGLVVATGGRLMLDPANAATLGAAARVFCLAAEPDEIVRRVLDDDGHVRPLLAGDDPEAKVREILAERAAGYAAFEQVPTTGRLPAEIVAEIAARLADAPGRADGPAIPHHPHPNRSTTVSTTSPHPPRLADSEFVDPVFVDRTSTRSFTGEPVSDAELAAIFEAARWTPSWFNNQPWLYVVATSETGRAAVLDVFLEANRSWARNAPVAGLVMARTELEGFMARSRDFDTGMATMAMTIQAARLGLSVHLLGGIDLDAAYALTGEDRETTEIICGFVIGHKGDGSELDEKYRAREAPSPRKPVSDFVRHLD